MFGKKKETENIKTVEEGQETGETKKEDGKVMKCVKTVGKAVGFMLAGAAATVAVLVALGGNGGEAEIESYDSGSDNVPADDNTEE